MRPCSLTSSWPRIPWFETADPTIPLRDYREAASLANYNDITFRNKRSMWHSIGRARVWHVAHQDVF